MQGMEFHQFLALTSNQFLVKYSLMSQCKSSLHIPVYQNFSYYYILHYPRALSDARGGLAAFVLAFACIII
jgi:hypothetical protein